MEIDEMLAAQKILEGRCCHCDYILPAHHKGCPDHPYRAALDRYVQLSDRIKEYQAVQQNNNE